VLHAFRLHSPDQVDDEFAGFPPRRDTRFAAGDQAYLVGPYEELLQVLRADAEGVSA
jgi:hypothetical protein